jgi:hypothetical protein
MKPLYVPIYMQNKDFKKLLIICGDLINCYVNHTYRVPWKPDYALRVMWIFGIVLFLLLRYITQL